MGGAGLIPRLLLALGWLIGSLWWLSADRLLRDGDEEGHVGAAELLVAILHEEGLLSFVWTALAGDLGEYPPLYPAAVAGWWAIIGGQPGAAAVRAVNLLWPLLSAAALSGVARHLRLPPATGLLVLLVPGVCGLSRHFMPEGMLIAAVSLTALAAVRAVDRPTLARAGALGVALGLGCLTKQTFVLYAAPVALWALWRLRIRGLLTIGTASLLAGPWYLTHLSDQAAYGSQSLTTTDPGLLLTLGYYPAVGALTELGPVLTIALLLGLWQADHTQRRTLLLWVGLALLLLVAVPRKYPRLLVPLLPLAVLCAGPWLTTARRAAAVAVPAGAWALLGSLVALPTPALGIDEGCLQRWQRPPVSDDFGMAHVAEVARQRGVSVIVVLDPPEIPCTVQTTHGWLHHLPPYLRRDGVEVEVVTEPTPGALIVDWTGGPSAAPLLDSSYQIR